MIGIELKKKTQHEFKYIIDFIIYFFAHLLTWSISIFPYTTRIPLGANFFRLIISPILGNKKKIHQNLSHVMPHLSNSQKNELAKSITKNIGRTIFELFSPEAFSSFASKAKISGQGFEILKRAHKSGRPVILVSGHFGNYDVVRAKLKKEKIAVGALYKPMQNKYFNQLYLEKISSINEPLFPKDRKGMNEMMKFLKSGNCIAVLFDQVMGKGEPLMFFGQPAYTATSVAKMAIKYDALLIPFFSERLKDGVNFNLFFGEPISHEDPKKMTQCLNDLLEDRIRNNMDQWLWTHRRWKVPPNINPKDYSAKKFLNR